MADAAPAPVAPAAAPAPAPDAPAADAKPGEAEGAVVDPKVPPAALAPDEPWRKAKHKVRVENREDEIEYDELVRGYQRAKVATKRFEEAAAKEQQLEQLLHAMKTDPRVLWDVARELGHDPKDLAAALMLEDAADSKLSPEALELRDVKARLARSEAAEKEREAEVREAEEVRAAQKEMVNLKTRIETQLKAVGVPITKAAIARFVQIAGGDPRMADSEVVAAAVREEYVEEMRAILENEDGVKLLGESGLKRLRAADLARVKSPLDPATAPAPPVGEQRSSGKAEKKSGPLSLEAFEDRLRKRA